MVIKTTSTQVRNTFKGVIETELSSREMIFVDAYGEPQVDVGGVINLYDPETDELLDPAQDITLVSKETYIRSGFPVEQSFDGNTDSLAATKLYSWLREISVRLTTAKTTLMAKPAPNSPDVSVVEV
jgi:hypothetical protein